MAFDGKMGNSSLLGLVDGVTVDGVKSAFNKEGVHTELNQASIPSFSLIIQLFQLTRGQDHSFSNNIFVGRSLQDQLKIVYNILNDESDASKPQSFDNILSDLVQAFEKMHADCLLDLRNTYPSCEDSVFGALDKDFSSLSVSEQLSFIESLNSNLYQVSIDANMQKFDQFKVSLADFAKTHNGDVASPRVTSVKRLEFSYSYLEKLFIMFKRRH